MVAKFLPKGQNLIPTVGKTRSNELEPDFPPVRLIPAPVVETEWPVVEKNKTCLQVYCRWLNEAVVVSKAESAYTDMLS
jgi:hypothetical protein